MSRSLGLVGALSFSLVGSLVGCAGSSKVSRTELDARRAELDQVTVAFVAPAGCQQVGNVYADDFNPGRMDRATETARMRLQLKALELGANYVHAPPAQIMYSKYGAMGASIQGDAYRCAPKPVATPAVTAAPPVAVPAPVVVLSSVKPTDVVVGRIAPKLDECARAEAVVVRNLRGSTVEAIEELRREASARNTNYAHIVTVERPQLSEVVVNATTYRCPSR
jgi:hypothetical protein